MSTKAQRANRDALVYACRSIIGQLRAHARGNKGIDLGLVPDMLAWCWETFEQYSPRDIGPFQEELEKALNEAEELVQNFNFEQAEYEHLEYLEAIARRRNRG